MATREQKKQRLKATKLKQKENREKNKNIEVAVTEEDVLEIDFSNITKFKGIRAYTLLSLDEIINSLKDGDYNVNEIIRVAKMLREYAKEPINEYNKFLKQNKGEISAEDKKAFKKLLRDSKYGLNTTERAVLRMQMESILMTFMWGNTNYESIDYGAMRVAFEVAYMAILKGLREKKIKSLELFVGYGDILQDIKVSYKDSSDKYNLNESIALFPIWKALDELYNKYTIYKHTYINFSESSLNSLATAYATLKQYEERNDGKELISYNGVALNYLSVLEVELKKLISQRTGVDKGKLRLVEAIDGLRELEIDFLSDEEMIEKLHEIRKIRNRVAHGEDISLEEINYIERILLTSEVLKFISWNLNK